LRLSDENIHFNWENSVVSVSSPWFSVKLAEPLPPEWSDRAVALATAGHGSLTLQTDSGAVTITLVMAKKGELNVSIRLQQPPDLLHEVRLFFNPSQSELPTLFADGIGYNSQHAV